MKSKLSLLATACLFLAGGMLFSCQKNSSQQSAPVSDAEAQTMSQDNANADAQYDDLNEMGFSTGADLEAMDSAGGETPGTAAGAGVGVNLGLFADLYYKIGPCTTITVEPNDTTYPRKVTIDFGEGCLCRDGRYRSGAVILDFSAPLRRAGSVLTITLRDYYVDRAHIEGVKTIENESADGAIKYSVKVEDGKITWPGGRGFTYTGSKTVTQTDGMGTRTVRDDVYSVEGSSETDYASGIVVKKTTETPLIKPVACGWFVKGILKIQINDRTLYIDFGDGDCDNQATLSWSGGERVITLP